LREIPQQQMNHQFGLQMAPAQQKCTGKKNFRQHLRNLWRTIDQMKILTQGNDKAGAKLKTAECVEQPREFILPSWRQ